MYHSDFLRRNGLFPVLLLLPAVSLATNGMNNEGYGPVSAAMGGAGQAFENGSAAAMNNPATLTLMPEGSARLDLAIGLLKPTVSALYSPMPKAESVADLFMMPAFGYTRRTGVFTFGAALFAQGGMGTDYGHSSFLSAGSGKESMSQVGVGRFSVPLGWKATEKLGLGMTLDYVWATMDVEMVMAGAGQFAGFVSGLGGSQHFGSASGSMVDGLGSAVQAGQLRMPDADYATNPMAAGPVNWAHFSFRDDSDFTGQASGAGMALKLGAVYTVNQQWSVGFSYHGETALSDLEADAATLSMSANFDTALLAQQWNGIPVSQSGSQGAPSGFYAAADVPVHGNITVKDFQWPAQLSMGAAYRPAETWLVAMDLKRIGWSSVMEDFRMTFQADANQINPLAGGFASSRMDLVLKQDWKDQWVMALGAAWQPTADLALRCGFNHAGDPVPQAYLNPLFPAIVESHVTLGAGYHLSPRQSLDASLQIVPEAESRSASGVTSAHNQLNLQVMYSLGF